jgi:hypothetical protein
VRVLQDLKWPVDEALLTRMKEENQKTLKTMDETIVDARGGNPTYLPSYA